LFGTLSRPIFLNMHGFMLFNAICPHTIEILIRSNYTFLNY
jgi:hypothetical protein